MMWTASPKGWAVQQTWQWSRTSPVALGASVATVIMARGEAGGLAQVRSSLEGGDSGTAASNPVP